MPSSTLWAFVLPSLSVACVFLSEGMSVRSLAYSLGRALGLGHGPIVEQRPEYPPDDRPKHVQPDAREVTRDQHRPKRARRFYRAPGNGSGDKAPDRQSKPNRYRRDRGGSPLVCGHGHHHEHEDEGDQDLHDEGLQISDSLRGLGGRQLRLASRGSPEGYPGSKRRQHRSRELRAHVVWDELPGELLGGGHPQSDRGVYVRPGDVPHGSDHGGQREPEGERHGQRVVGGPRRGASEDRGYRHGRPAEDQDEGSHELGYGRADDVGGIYLAAVEATASGLLPLLLVEGTPGATADVLFQTRLLFRADRVA